MVYKSGSLFESAGRYGASGVYEKDLPSGKTLRARANSREIFAEGLTLLGGELFQLSWRNHLGFVYDQELRELRRFTYPTEGWGLTDDGRQLIMSDGSSTLYWLNPADFKTTRSVEVRDAGAPVVRLNELEYARGMIFANVWMSDRVAVIAPGDGVVRAWLDLSPLKQGFTRPPQWDENDDVLNGIAYDARQDLFYVTGKCWPVMYELRIDQLR